ncbi:uncharacterized protein LOC111604348 [Drosophila hydei]|uniref:Uncharacterized protein LOC111604348 n=1 Tax=Drosophila hydei TaxID=7224 RepID=A0A6J1MFL9_DROHY|nr:uncharacterized protein LOC111604348 [Drosophila hydei]
MPTRQLYVYTCFGYVLFSLMFDINGLANKCFNCESRMTNCQPPEDLCECTSPLKDSMKLVPLEGQPNAELEDCLKPNMNLTAPLVGVLCSITKNNTCGVTSNEYNDVDAVCWSCNIACNCHSVTLSNAVRDVKSAIYLDAFPILLYITSLIIYQHIFYTIL